MVAYHQWAGDLAEKPFRIVAGPFLSEWEAIDQAKKLGIDAGVEPCVLSELVSGRLEVRGGQKPAPFPWLKVNELN